MEIKEYTSWNGIKRKWRYSEEERPRNENGNYSAECYDCSIPYDAIGDCSLDNEVWEDINPTEYQGAGILCPNCILQRLHQVGLYGIKVTLW